MKRNSNRCRMAACLVLTMSLPLWAAGPPGGGGGGSGAVTTLKVLTFNGWVHLSQGVNNVAQDIKSTGADIAGLQECNGIDAKALCSALGVGWNFAQGYSAGDYTIVSRFPILKRVGETVQPYGGIGATIELSAGQRVHLFNCHLNWTPYGPYQLVLDGMTPTQVIASENNVRMPGLNELLNIAAGHIASAEPTFLVGDFNAPSDHDYNPLVNWPTSIACRNAGLTDSYFQLHSTNPKKSAGQFLINDPGITWTPIASSEPHGCYDRIDFVHYSNGDASPSTSSELTFDSSDHRVVLTTFAIAMPARQAKASSPLPANSGAGADRHPLLTWVSGSGATSHELYLGTASPGAFQGALSDSKFSPALLSRNTKYFWRVDTVTASGKVTGDVWSFTSVNGPGMNPTKAVYAKNEMISLAFDGGSSSKDWIGIYKRGDAYGSGAASLDWKYLNNSQTAPGNTVSSGTISLKGQKTVGSYVIRFFYNDGYRVLDEVPLTVQ